MRLFRARILASFSCAALAVLVLSGCNSFQSRAKKKADVFATLDEPTRVRLEAREIRVGDTPDMVYIALGTPEEKTERVTATGRDATWTYVAYWQEYQGTRLVGYRRESFYDPATKSYRVIYQPDYQPVYAPRAEDRLRITFENGLVSVVEQAKPSAKPAGSVK